MREPYCSARARKPRDAPILTGWLREIRGLVAGAAAKRGHPIRLGVRVPSRPETAFGMGLDAIAWAKEGLIDQLVVTPRWATLEYDMPLPQWRQLLAGSKVTLGRRSGDHLPPGRRAADRRDARAGHGGRPVGALRRGGCRLPLQLFPGCPPGRCPFIKETLRAMASLDSLIGRPRAVAITFRDVTAPGEDYRPLVPATGKELVFPMKLGPLPKARRQCQLLIGLAPSSATLAASVNGKPCEVCSDTMKDGLRLVSFTFPPRHWPASRPTRSRLAAKSGSVLTIQQVEMSLRP